MSDKSIQLSSATFISKDKYNNKIPKGAKILSENPTITVEEIENGFIITVNKDISFMTKDGNKDYCYLCKKTFSKTNPLNIDLEKFENKTLASIFTRK